MESAQICAVLMVSIPVTLGKNRAVMSLHWKCPGLRSEKIAGVGSWVAHVLRSQFSYLTGWQFPALTDNDVFSDQTSLTGPDVEVCMDYA